MKIGAIVDSTIGAIADPLPQVPGNPVDSAAAGAVSSSPKVAASGVDSVELSPASRSLHDTSQPFDAAKVQAITNQIENGKFKTRKWLLRADATQA